MVGHGFNRTQSGYITIIDGKVRSSLSTIKLLFEVHDAGTQSYSAYLSIESIVKI